MDRENGGHLKESQGKEVETAQACHEKYEGSFREKVEGNKVQGKRKRGRMEEVVDNGRADLREKGLSGEEVYNRATWRRVLS